MRFLRPQRRLWVVPHRRLDLPPAQDLSQHREDGLPPLRFVIRAQRQDPEVLQAGQDPILVVPNMFTHTLLPHKVEEVHLLDTLLVCQDRDRAVCQWLEVLPLLVLL